MLLRALARAARPERHASAAPRGRRRALTVAVALAASLLSGTVAASPAHAAVVGSGTLQPKVSTTLTMAQGDTAAYDIAVPAGTSPVFHVTDMSADLSVLVRVGGPDPDVAFGSAFVDGFDTSTWLVMTSQPVVAAGAGTVSLQSFGVGTGSITFTVDFASDTTVPVADGQDVPLTFDVPGDRALLTFDAGFGFTVTATITSNTLTDPPPTSATQTPIDQLALTLRGSFDQRLQKTGNTFTGTVFTGGPQTLVVDPGADVTGTVTLRLDIQPPLSGDLFYGADATPVTLGTPGSPVLYGLTARNGAATLLQVISPALTHDDGSDGTATVELLVPGKPARRLGTVTGTSSTTFSTDTPLDSGRDTVRITPDATTTGSLRLRATFDAAPATVVPTATATPFSLSAGTPLARLTVDLPAGDSLVAVRDLVDDFPGFSFDALRLVVLDDTGSVVFDQSVFDGTSQFLTTATAGTYTIELIRGETAVGSAVRGTLTIAPDVTLDVQGTLPFDQVVTTTLPGQRVDVAIPATAGQVVTARLTDEQWTLPANDPFTPSANVIILDDRGALISNGGTPAYAESVPLTRDMVVHVRVDPETLTVGSARLLVSSPTNVTGTLAPGTATPLTLAEPGAKGVFTIQAVAGLPVAVSISDIVITKAAPFGFSAGDVRITDPNGQDVAFGSLTPGETSWTETFAPAATSGTYTVTIDPFLDTTLTATVTGIIPKLTTQTVRSGQTVSLVFAPGDQNQLTFTAASAGLRPVLQSPGQTATFWFGTLTLRDSAGSPLAQTFFSNTTTYMEFAPLPAAGTYTFTLDLFGNTATTLSESFLLAADQPVTTKPGERASLSWKTGQHTTLRIPVKKGQHPAVDISALRVVGGSGIVKADLFAPGESFPRASQFLGTGFGTSQAPVWIEPPGVNLAQQDEVWTLVLTPDQGTTGSMTYTTYSSKDVVQPIKTGRATKVVLPERNVDARLTFTGTAATSGRIVNVDVTASTFPDGAWVWTIGPSGFAEVVAVVPPGGTSASGANFFDPVQAGVGYTVVVSPVGRSTGSAQVTVSLL